MSNPYKIEPYKDGYSFVTADGVFYYAFFTAVEGNYFPRLSELRVDVLSFGFTPLNKNDFEAAHQDMRISATIIHILEQAFENDKTILLFVIENSDGKHHARNRIFNKWHKVSNSRNIEKFDGVIEIAGGETVLSSLLVHTDNIYKQTTVYEFYSLIKELNKDGK